MHCKPMKNKGQEMSTPMVASDKQTGRRRTPQRDSNINKRKKQGREEAKKGCDGGERNRRPQRSTARWQQGQKDKKSGSNKSTSKRTITYNNSMVAIAEDEQSGRGGGGRSGRGSSEYPTESCITCPTPPVPYPSPLFTSPVPSTRVREPNAPCTVQP